MICRQCLRRASTLRASPSLPRSFASAVSPGKIATASPRTSGPPTATSTGAAQPFSTPLSPSPNAVSLGKSLHPKTKSTPIPVSSCPAGTPLKGLNFLKGKEDPLALPEEEYPEWLWSCLDGGKKSAGDGSGDSEGDLFAKSKKQRRAAAKAQRKLEARLIASGNLEALTPKIPLQQQSIDLPWNEKGDVDGALEAAAAREELRSAMRQERRAKIKESNFLKGMR